MCIIHKALTLLVNSFILYMYVHILYYMYIRLRYIIYKICSSIKFNSILLYYKHILFIKHQRWLRLSNE